MKRFRTYFSKWYVQLALVLIPLIMGLVGYTAYYHEYYRLTTDKCSYGQPILSALGLFGLSYSAEWIDGTDRWAWYYVVLNIARYLAIIPTGHVVFRLLRPLLGRFFAGIRASLWSRRTDRLLVIGANDENIGILQSSMSRRDGMMACAPDESVEGPEREGVPCLQTDLEPLIVDQIQRTLRRGGTKCTILINTHDEARNLHLCRAAAACLRQAVSPDRDARDALARRESAGTLDPEGRRKLVALEGRLVDLLERLHLVVFSDSRYEAIYLDLQRESMGILRHTNKYRMAALDFVLQHPLTEHLRGPRGALLDDRACVAPDADINVLLVGFGETNQELLKVSFATNQFIQPGTGGVPQPKPVSYHIFDRHDARKNRNLNHSLFRYCIDFTDAIETGRLCREDYLALPPTPARLSFHVADVDDLAFYRQVHDICTSNPRSVNTVIIAVGDDLTNIDLSHRLLVKRLEWGLDNLFICVKIRDARNEALARDLNGDDFIAFGNEDPRLRDILEPEIERMALRRNLMYALEKSGASAGDNLREAEVRTRYSWYTMDRDRRQSNIFDAISLRMKLQLIGLDCAPRSGRPDALATNDDYFAIYAGEDRPQARADDRQSLGKALYTYEHIRPLSAYVRGSLRDNLAVQEHYRWNAYMIMCGFIPATLGQMRSGAVKSYPARFHGNLTTFEGLFDFRRKMAEWNGTDEAAEDVVRWDYQLMDDAWWFLHENDMEMFRRDADRATEERPR